MNYLIIGLIIVILIILIVIFLPVSQKEGIENNNLSSTLPTIDTIEIKNFDNPVQLVEVEVFDKDDSNVASIGIPSQSSTLSSDANDLYLPKIATDKLMDVQRTSKGIVGITSTIKEDVSMWSLNFAEPIEIKMLKIWYWNDVNERSKMKKITLSIYKNNTLINERELNMNLKLKGDTNFWLVDYTTTEEKKENDVGLMSAGGTGGPSSYELESLLKEKEYTPHLPTSAVEGSGGGSYGGATYYPSSTGASLPFTYTPSAGDTPSAPSTGIRYVRIQNATGGEHIISLCEVQVFDEAMNNIALGRPAIQSSNFDPAHGLADRAVDNKRACSYDLYDDVTHTMGNDIPSFWEVDLGAERKVIKVVVWNRMDWQMPPRINGLLVLLLNGSRQEVRRFGPMEGGQATYEYVL